MVLVLAHLAVRGKELERKVEVVIRPLVYEMR
jgi:hypothetical protein